MFFEKKGIEYEYKLHRTILTYFAFDHFGISSVPFTILHLQIAMHIQLRTNFRILVETKTFRSYDGKKLWRMKYIFLKKIMSPNIY